MRKEFCWQNYRFAWWKSDSDRKLAEQTCQNEGTLLSWHRSKVYLSTYVQFSRALNKSIWRNGVFLWPSLLNLQNEFGHFCCLTFKFFSSKHSLGRRLGLTMCCSKNKKDTFMAGWPLGLRWDEQDNNSHISLMLTDRSRSHQVVPKSCLCLTRCHKVFGTKAISHGLTNCDKNNKRNHVKNGLVIDLKFWQVLSVVEDKPTVNQSLLEAWPTKECAMQYFRLIDVLPLIREGCFLSCNNLAWLVGGNGGLKLNYNQCCFGPVPLQSSHDLVVGLHSPLKLGFGTHQVVHMPRASWDPEVGAKTRAAELSCLSLSLIDASYIRTSTSQPPSQVKALERMIGDTRHKISIQIIASWL